MADNTERMLGEISGKLDRLTDNFDKYLAFHDQRHENLDSSVRALEADINQAKGARTAIYAGAAVVAGVVGFAVDAVAKLLK